MEIYIIGYTLIGIVLIWLFSLPLKILAMNFRLVKSVLRLKNIGGKKPFLK